MNDSKLIAALGGETPAFSLAYLRESPDCVLVLNPQGRISFISETGSRLLELPDTGVVVGRGWWELWPIETQALLRENFSRAKAGELVRFVAACPTWEGTPVRWDMTLAPVVNADGHTESLLAILKPMPGQADSG